MSALRFLFNYAVNGVHYNLDLLVKECINNTSWKVRYDAAKLPDLTSDQVEKLANDTNSIIRAQISVRIDLTPKQIEKLVNDKNNVVRYEIALHPNLLIEQARYLANDPCPYVSEIAINRLKDYT